MFMVRVGLLSPQQTRYVCVPVSLPGASSFHVERRETRPSVKPAHGGSDPLETAQPLGNLTATCPLRPAWLRCRNKTSFLSTKA